MKKYLLIIAVLIIAGSSYADSLKPAFFSFSGRWQPSEDPALIEGDGFTDIQNLRREGKRLKGVSGHSRITTTAIGSSTPTFKNGFQFKKNSPQESHVFTQWQTGAGASTVARNATAIPSAGDYSGTAFHTDSGSGLGRFSSAPRDHMLYCNGAEALIWGGSETWIGTFFASDTDNSATAEVKRDYTDALIDSESSSDSTVTLSSGGLREVLLLHCNGSDTSTTFTDNGDTGHTVTATGNAQVDTADKKFGTGSALFDGTGDYLTIPDHADWAADTGTFTIDFWIKFNTLPATSAIMGIFQQYVDANNYVACYLYKQADDDYRFYFLVKEGGTFNVNHYQTISNPALLTDWMRVAIVRGWGDNDNNVAIAYGSPGTDATVSNHSMAATAFTAAPNDDWPDLAAAFEIGRFATGSYFDGWIDEFRYTKEESYLEGAVWTSAFTYNTAENSAANTIYYLGTTRPIQGMKFYISSGSTDDSLPVVRCHSGSSAWDKMTLTDTTTKMSTTGSLTFTSTVSTAKKLMLSDIDLYWYMIYFPTGQTNVYQITVDAPVQAVGNIWDGETIPVSSCKKFVNASGLYIDYTDEVNDDTDTFVAVLDSLTTSDYLYLGFGQQMQGFTIEIPPGKENSTATADMVVQYWDGDSWNQASFQDKTEIGGTNSLGKNGLVSFRPYYPWLYNETPVDIGDGNTLYYYRLSWDAALDAETEISHIEGVPAPQSIGTKYKFGESFQNRAFLFKDNYALYSAFDSADIWNGEDSGKVYFGESNELTAACTLSNIYESTPMELMLVTNLNETYRLYGNTTETWAVQKISSHIGCPAPLSMVACDVSNMNETSIKHVAIWQSGNTFVLSDGATINDIGEDVKCYFDKNDSRAIPTSRIDDTFAWYDTNLQAYKVLISSGSGQATHNIELEYSLANGEWTKIYRANGSGANPLQIGFPVIDIYGNSYSYGMTAEGHLYRLENGLTWNGTAINQSLTTKDILLDKDNPFWTHTTAEYIRLGFQTKATGATEDININHYCDGTLTVDGTSGQELPPDADLANGPFETADCILGPCLYHRFKLDADISTVADGLELSGMGIYYRPSQTIIED